MNTKNVKIKKGYKVVCVWPGTSLGDSTPEEFIGWLKEEFGVRAQFLETIVTGPDQDELGNLIENTGGRKDLFFVVHGDDVGKFSVPRLTVGIRWLEDVLASINYQSKIYPARVFEYPGGRLYVDEEAA